MENDNSMEDGSPAVNAGAETENLDRTEIIALKYELFHLLKKQVRQESISGEINSHDKERIAEINKLLHELNKNHVKIQKKS